LKLHGDVNDPDGVVLSRDDYVRFDAGRRPLAALVQALLMTRHMLFVGFSLVDDNFIRLAHEVRDVLGASGEPGRVGTVLSLFDEPLRHELWKDDLRFIVLAPEANPNKQADKRAAARALEIVLDRIAVQASKEHSYLLDPAYQGMLGPTDRALADRLTALLPDGVAASAAWPKVEALLRAFGARTT
jgi:hypothetical protein